jgi:hypothetical protein
VISNRRSNRIKVATTVEVDGKLAPLNCRPKGCILHRCYITNYKDAGVVVNIISLPDLLHLDMEFT